MAALTALTALARTLLAGTTTAAMQTTLGLGTAATQPYEDTGTFTVTATGFSGTAPSGTARYVRMGKQLTVKLPTLTGTSTAVTFTLTGIPSALWPPAGQGIYVSVRAWDNGVLIPAHLNVPASGTWTVGLYSATANWTASGTKTLDTCAVTYML